jgi:hypothetical protein
MIQRRHRMRAIAAAPRTMGGMRSLILVILCGALIGHAAPAAAQTPEVVFEIGIENGRVPPRLRLIRVKQGDAVRLRWTSDRPIIVHLHGYDIETRVEPGAVAETTFTARATGRFPVEEHKPAARGHSHGEAPLVRIEVRPR